MGFWVERGGLRVGGGAMIGRRAWLSVLVGGILAWGVLGPRLLASGAVEVGEDAGDCWDPAVVEWLLWPGVALMVSASLTAFALAIARRRPVAVETAAAATDEPISRRAFWIGFGATLLLAAASYTHLTLPTIYSA